MNTVNPAFFDFTKPRLGHSFHVESKDGLFADKFPILEATIFYDPTNDTIRIGDIIYYLLPSGRKGMFRVFEIKDDPESENLIYCKVVNCGYFDKKPIFFKGFTDEWYKMYPTKTEKIPNALTPPNLKPYLTSNKSVNLTPWYLRDGFISILVSIMFLISIVCGTLITIFGGK